MRGNELQRSKVIWRCRHRAEERPAGRKFTYARDSHHVIAEAIERIEYPLSGHRKVGPLIHAQEEDAQSRGQFSLPVQSQERLVHLERVSRCEPVENEGVLGVPGSGFDELTHVDVRGHTEAGRIGHGIERPPFQVVRSLQGSERMHRSERRGAGLDLPRFADLHAMRRQIGPAPGVRNRRPP